jgi:hypothetical protein
LKTKHYDPSELKILFETLNQAPSYLSKRFILSRLCGWSTEMIEENANLKVDEEVKKKMGDRSWT